MPVVFPRTHLLSLEEMGSFLVLSSAGEEGDEAKLLREGGTERPAETEGHGWATKGHRPGASLRASASRTLPLWMP